MYWGAVELQAPWNQKAYKLSPDPPWQADRQYELLCFCFLMCKRKLRILHIYNYGILKIKWTTYDFPLYCVSKQKAHIIMKSHVMNINDFKVYLQLIPLPLSLTFSFSSAQFSSVTQSCPTLWDPMNRSTPGLPVHHQLPEFTQTHAHRVSDAIQPSHPLSSPSPPAPNPSQHKGLFQWVNSSHEMAKVLEFQLQHQSFQWTPRTDLL